MAKELSGNEASIPNPALEPLSVLVGKWKTVGTHRMIPGKTFHGHTTFSWLEGGAFLIMHSEIDEPEIPNGVAVYGSDDAAAGAFYMLYFDERGVSRKYDASLRDNTWKWWRDAQDFSQRFTGTIVDNGRTIIGTGQLCRDGVTWEGDLELTYTRAD